jgi:DNA-binding NtrC family response regulator
MNVLIIDDEKVMRDLISQVLTVKGHVTVQASSGKEGIELVQQKHFDVVFLDIMMPEMDGVEILKKIKAVKPDGVSVIMMTGYAVEEKLREAMTLGAFDFLYKPFDIIEIVIMLDKIEKKKGLKNP